MKRSKNHKRSPACGRDEASHPCGSPDPNALTKWHHQCARIGTLKPPQHGWPAKLAPCIVRVPMHRDGAVR